MAEQDGAHGFLDAAAITFLARRLHNRRLRAAAGRGVKGLSAEVDADLRTDVGHATDCLASIPSGTAAPASSRRQPCAAQPIRII